MPKIYTKVGDKGQTSLVGGQKTSKSDPRIEAYGTIDELNSFLGLARVALGEAACMAAGAANPKGSDGLMQLSADLETLQHWLFDLGSLLAALPTDREKFNLTVLSVEQIQWLESKIDGATAILTPLKNFILPAGSKPAVHLHVARTVARRAERGMVELGTELPESAVPFINRVSDYLFVMARYANHLLGVQDVLWEKHSRL